MFHIVRDALAKQLRIPAEQITPDSSLIEDLGADSLSVLQLLMTMEEDYGMKIPDEKLATFERVRDIVTYLEEQKAQE